MVKMMQTVLLIAICKVGYLILRNSAVCHLAQINGVRIVGGFRV